jgi:hemin uptake protein HemP
MFSSHIVRTSTLTAGSGSSAGRRAPTPVAEVDSRQLLEGRRELLIRHGEERYRLRHTRNDKLILTK